VNSITSSVGSLVSLSYSRRHWRMFTAGTLSGGWVSSLLSSWLSHSPMRGSVARWWIIPDSIASWFARCGAAFGGIVTR